MKKLIKRNIIYTVTTMDIGYKIIPRGLRKGKRIIAVRDSRVVAWYKKLRNAERCIEKNCCDINELGSYNYVVIEKIEEGVYPDVIQEYWFKWNGDLINGKYKPSNKPRSLKRVLNFGIG